MAALHQEGWGQAFSEIVMAVLNDFWDGKPDALSLFMESEKESVLSDVPMLCLPPAPAL